MNFGPLGYTREAVQFSLYCLPERFCTIPGLAARVYSLLLAATRPGKWHLAKRQFVLCTLTEWVQQCPQVEVFPVCFSEESLNLNFAVSQSSAAKSSNLKRVFCSLRSSRGEANPGFNLLDGKPITVTCVCVLKQQIKMFPMKFDPAPRPFCNYSKQFCFYNVATRLEWFLSLTYLLNSNICIHYGGSMLNELRSVQGESH